MKIIELKTREELNGLIKTKGLCFVDALAAEERVGRNTRLVCHEVWTDPRVGQSYRLKVVPKEISTIQKGRNIAENMLEAFAINFKNLLDGVVNCSNDMERLVLKIVHPQVKYKELLLKKMSPEDADKAWEENIAVTINSMIDEYAAANEMTIETLVEPILATDQMKTNSNLDFVRNLLTAKISSSEDEKEAQ